MTENENIHDELRDSAPFLAKRKKADPFAAPEGYFERFPTEIQERVNSRSEVVEGASWRPWATALAMLVIGLSFFFLLSRNEMEINSIVAVDPVELSSSDDYILNEVDEATLVAAYEEQLAYNSVEEVEGNIEDYILENIDENLLIEEL